MILLNFLKSCPFQISDNSRNKNSSYEWTTIKTIHSFHSNNNMAISLKSSRKVHAKIEKTDHTCVYMYVYYTCIHTYNILSNKKQEKAANILSL